MALTGIITGSLLILIGFYAILSKNNLMKMVIGFSLANTGVHIIIVALGYIRNRTAPILDSAVASANPEMLVVDPVPQALVLTAIVIGFGITATMLVFVWKLHEKFGTLEISKIGEAK
jgi:multisubunit Na+/H+ antiporter MnhC subunit